jgi:hypothetical protein
LGDLAEDYLIPARQIFNETERYGRKKLTVKEAAEITYNLTPIRIYLDYRNGLNYIRKFYLVDGHHVALLVDGLDNTLQHFIRSWYDTFKPGPVRVFGYLNYAGVDAEDGTFLPEIIQSDDPTDILLEGFPGTGIKKVITNPRPDIKSEVEDLIRTRVRGKKSHLKNNLCNVKSYRRRVNKSNLQKYANEIKKLSQEKIKEIEENRELSQEENAKNFYKNVI